MQIIVSIAAMSILLIAPAIAQGKPQPKPAISPLSDMTPDQKAAETKRWIEIGRKRQEASDARNTRIWKRWDYAVCIGCGPIPKNLRIVYTTPSRVLAGYIAADDDANGMKRGKRLRLAQLLSISPLSHVVHQA